MDFPIYRGKGEKARLPPSLSLGAVRIAGDWQARGQAYDPDPGLQHAVSVAFLLGKPLLVTGEPGVGKSDLASSIAHAFDRGEPIKLECKSSSMARDLFYSYDTLGRYLSAQIGSQAGTEPTEAEKSQNAGPLAYIRYQGLGEAIVRADPGQVAEFLPEGWMDDKQKGPTVVLIDEVDKAPRDFPNDILNEIEKMYFRVAELGNVRLPPRELPAALRPFVLITSNSEKNLPEAFLRRCVFYHIPFPEEKLESIARSHFPHLAAGSNFLSSATELFLSLRHAEVQWEKAPSTAEYLDWIQAMLSIETTGQETGNWFDSDLRRRPDLVRQCMGTLGKSVADGQSMGRLLDQWLEA